MIKHFYVDFLTAQWFFLNSHYHSRWQWCWHSVAKFQKKLWFQNKVNILCTKKNNSLLNLDTTYIIINYHGYEEEIQRGKIQNPILLFYWFIHPECYPLRKLKKSPACKKVTFDATLVLTSHSSSCVRDVHLYFLKRRNGNYFSTCTLKFSHEKLIYNWRWNINLVFNKGSLLSVSGNPDAPHITAIAGDNITLNCDVNFPNGVASPYVVQWWRKVSISLIYFFINQLLSFSPKNGFERKQKQLDRVFLHQIKIIYSHFF